MKKFLKVFLLCMAVLTVLTVAVSAADYELYADGDPDRGTNQTTLTAPEEGDEIVWYWFSDNPAVATVNSSSGVVTAVAPGTANILLRKNGELVVDYSKSILVKNRELTEIKILQNPDKTEYMSGDRFDPTGMIVQAIYNNGDEVITTDYTCDPMALTAKVSQVVVKVTQGTNEKTAIVNVTVKELTITEVKLTLSKVAFNAGDSLPTFTVKVKWSDGSEDTISSGYDIYLGGEKISSSKKLAATDNGKKIKVVYKNESSNEVAITVAAKPAFDPQVVITGTFTNTTYKVGDTLNWAGISALTLKDKNSGTAEKTFLAAELLTLSSSSPLAYKFTKEDVGTNKTITIEYTIGDHKYEIRVPGLTIQDTLGELKPYKLTGLVLDDTSYPVGYTFSVTDIYYIQYTKSLNGNPFTAYGSEVERYSDTMSLEVLTATGNRKSFYRQTYRSVIEAEDIYTENGEKVVNVRFYMGNVYVDTQVLVKEAAVTVTYQNTTVGTYDSIDDAVRAVNALNFTDYPITASSVVITLGKDQKISTLVKVQVNRYIEIDLNGNKLTFYTSTVNSDMSQRYDLTIKNTSDTAGTFVYYGKSTTLSLEKGEHFSFYHDYDKAGILPGFYNVSLKYDSNGKVVSSPAADSNKNVEVAHGSNVTLTITPSNGYLVGELAVNTTKYDKNDEEYTEKTNNVVSFVLRVTEDCEIDVVFEKEVKEDDPTDVSDWENPFSDVSSYATYYSAVAFVNQNGLFKGTSNTKFSPSSTMTRAMFVTVLGRLAGIDEDTAERRYGTESEFTDVNKNDPRYGYYSYAVPYIAWATQNGIIEGHGGAEKGTFGPEDPITHQQMYVIMQRYANYIAKKPLVSTTGINLPYTDKSQIADWADYAVKYAYRMEYIITTSTNRISPTTNATRAELAMLIEKFAKNVLEWGAEE